MAVCIGATEPPFRHKLLDLFPDLCPLDDIPFPQANAEEAFATDLDSREDFRNGRYEVCSAAHRGRVFDVRPGRQRLARGLEDRNGLAYRSEVMRKDRRLGDTVAWPGGGGVVHFQPGVRSLIM